MIGLKADAGDNFKKRASIPLAPCTVKSRIFSYPIRPIHRTKVFISSKDNEHFGSLKRSKWKKLLNISKKCFL
jgi:hypothetical protein